MPSLICVGRVLRLALAATLAWAALPPAAMGQEPDDPIGDAGRTCWIRVPQPGCRMFIVTEVGGYVGLGDHAGSSASPTLDWGVMWNQSSRSAFGATLTVWGDDLFVGPAVRYRRWFDTGSLVIGLGVVVAADGAEKPGSLFGLLRYDLNDWFGVGVRPQWIRLDPCPSPCFGEPEHTRVYVGAELGSDWGRWASIVGAALVGLILATGG